MGLIGSGNSMVSKVSMAAIRIRLDMNLLRQLAAHGVPRGKISGEPTAQNTIKHVYIYTFRKIKNR